MTVIYWTLDGPLEGNERDGFRSHLAGVRYRILIPRQALIAAGHDVRLLPLPVSAMPTGFDVLILGKVYPSSGHQRKAGEQSLMLARHAQALGARVLVDVNDNHFNDPEVGPYWREVVRVADACVVGSNAMAMVVATHTDKPVRVIGDPLASPAGVAAVWSAPKGVRKLFASPERLKIVWYGTANNFPAMKRWAEIIASIKHQYRIRIVTKRHPAIDQFVRDNPAVEFVEWSEEAQWQAVADAHIVMIPTDPSDEKKAVKTGNRLTDAINAGRYVIASPLESYRPFAEFCTLTDNPVDAVRDYLANPEEALARLKRGQEAVREACGGVADKWLAVLS